jgi:hypothetical protein
MPPKSSPKIAKLSEADCRSTARRSAGGSWRGGGEAKTAASDGSPAPVEGGSALAIGEFLSGHRKTNKPKSCVGLRRTRFEIPVVDPFDGLGAVGAA